MTAKIPHTLHSIESLNYLLATYQCLLSDSVAEGDKRGAKELRRVVNVTIAQIEALRAA